MTKQAITINSVALSLAPVKFKKAGDGLVAQFKFSEKKADDNEKVEANIRKTIKNLKLKRTAITSEEHLGVKNKGMAGEGTYTGSGITLTWQRSYSYTNGTTYHTLMLKNENLK